MAATQRRAGAIRRRAAAASVVSATLLAATVVGPRAGAQDDSASTTTPGATSSASLRLDPAMIVFGDVDLGQSGSAPLTVTAEGGPIEDIHTFVDPPFSVDDGCVGIELRAGERCTIEVRFAPLAAGPVSAILEVEAFTADESVELHASTALEGTGIDSGPVPSSTSPPVATTSGGGVPPSSTSPGVPPTTSPGETREECDARALQARIAYSPRLQMRVGQSTAVEVRATTAGLEPPTTAPPVVSTTLVPQPLRCQVRARIIGNDFTIQPDDWQIASFLGTQEVSWLWLVTPNVVGDGLLLILQVQGLRFDEDAGEYVEAGEAFQETAEIRVDSKPKGLLSRINDVITGIVTHPVVVFLAGTGALAAAAGWMIGSRRRKQKSSADEPEDIPPPADEPPPDEPGDTSPPA